MLDERQASLRMADGRQALFAELYDRLKVLASRQKSRGGVQAMMCTTELVHETYLRIGDKDDRFAGPAQFFAYAARAMRHILTDAARCRIQPKRGGDQVRVDIGDPAVDAVYVDPHLALMLDAALNDLAREDSRAAQVVELHYFAGLEMDQVADLLHIATRTVDRDWRYARAFLAARANE